MLQKDSNAEYNRFNIGCKGICTNPWSKMVSNFSFHFLYFNLSRGYVENNEANAEIV